MDRLGTPARKRLRLSPPLLAASAAALLFGVPATALADDPGLATSPGGTSEVVLVEVDPSAKTLDKRAVRLSLGVAAHGVTIHDNGWRAYRLDDPLSAEGVRDLLADADAAGTVEVAQEVRALAVPNDPDWGQLWGLQNMGASNAWDGQGSPAQVVVAVTDTGVHTTHPDVTNVLWQNSGETAGNGIDDDGNGFVDDVEGWDFRGDDNSVYDDTNDNHGTHVSGTIAAERNNSTGIVGVTNNAVIMPLKFLGGPSGSGSTSDAVSAINYAVANGAKVINASWGSGYSQAVCDAVAAANAAGVVFVSAAGNGGSDQIGDNVNGNTASPASCSSAGNITVAALSSSNSLASFSNFGNVNVDLGAPGVGIRSAIPGGGYQSWSGTSMAAPHVAGAAALLLGLEPGLTPAQVETRLRDTGVATSSISGHTVSGRRLNLENVVDSATADPNQPGPPTLTSPSGSAILTDSSVSFDWAAPADLGGGVSGYDLTLNGSVAASTGPGTTAATQTLADGTYSWTVVAKGAISDDTSANQTRTVVVDTTAPSPFSVVAPASTNDPRPTMRWSAIDAASGIASYSLSLDGTTVANGASSFRWYRPTSDLTEGAHTVVVTATDKAGHSRTASASFTYTAPADPVEPPETGTGNEPTPRRGRVIARGGKLLIPVVASSATRKVLVKGFVKNGRRTTGRFGRAVKIARNQRYVEVKVSRSILKKRGRLVVRWRARAKDFNRWYTRRAPNGARRAAIKQQRRAVALKRAKAKRAAAKRKAAAAKRAGAKL